MSLAEKISERSRTNPVQVSAGGQALSGHAFIVPGTARRRLSSTRPPCRILQRSLTSQKLMWLRSSGFIRCIMIRRKADIACRSAQTCLVHCAARRNSWKLSVSRLGLNVGETTADGFLTLEAVTCLAACDKAPMFQTQGPDGLKYHENMNVDKTVDVISTLKRKS